MKYLILVLSLLIGISTYAETGIAVESLWNGLTDSSGNPLNAGKVYSYAGGTDTPKVLYTDVDLSEEADNPVILDSNGKALVFARGSYKFVIKTSADVTLQTVDDLSYAALETVSGDLEFEDAISQIVPGSTSFSLRNHADNVDNFICADAGTCTLRNKLSWSVADKGMELGGLAFSSAITGITGTNSLLRGSSDGGHDVNFTQVANSSSGNTFSFFKTRSTTTAPTTIVQAADDIFTQAFYGSDGAGSYISAAQFICEIDGTPGANDMPGACFVSTTPDGDTSPDPAMRWDSSQNTTAYGHLKFTTSGKTLVFEDGTAASKCVGEVTATGTTAVTVSTTCAESQAYVFTSRTSAIAGGVTEPGCWATNIVDGVSFDFDCNDAAENSTFDWWIIRSANPSP